MFLRRISLHGLFYLLCGLLGGLYLLNIYGILEQPPVHEEAPSVNKQRQLAVRQAMQHAWHGYRTYAFGKDELQPLTQSANLRWGNWSISLLDALDTLKLMNMDKEYHEAKQHVRHIDFTKSLDYYDVRVFEMIIRALGGLLGAYELDPDPLLLAKAEEVGRTLARAFDTPTGLPYASIDISLETVRGPYRICLAEAGTMQLEYKKLAKLTNNREYWRMAERVSDVLEAGSRKHRGLYPMDISVLTGQYFESDYSVGAAADSFYEYLLK
ncbi:hypothetical protein IWW36_005842, partial [Coemansia brasiliensis]